MSRLASAVAAPRSDWLPSQPALVRSTPERVAQAPNGQATRLVTRSMTSFRGFAHFEVIATLGTVLELLKDLSDVWLFENGPWWERPGISVISQASGMTVTSNAAVVQAGVP